MDLQTSIRALIASYFTGGPKAKPMAEAVAELVAPLEGLHATALQALAAARDVAHEATERAEKAEHLLRISNKANDEVVVEYRKECAARDKLAKFKAYVHARLDAAGVPVDPPSDHQAQGCRIGGRLDIVLAVVLAARGMVGKADARLELGDFASWNPQGIDFQPLLEALAPIEALAYETEQARIAAEGT